MKRVVTPLIAAVAALTTALSAVDAEAALGRALSGQAKSASFLTGLTLFGVASTHLDVLGTSWSLDIELQFYLLVPLIWAGLELCQRRGYRIMPIGITAGLTALGWFVQMRYGAWSVLSYLPPFLAGSLIWLCKPRASGLAALVGVGLFAAMGVVVYLTP